MKVTPVNYPVTLHRGNTIKVSNAITDAIILFLKNNGQRELAIGKGLRIEDLIMKTLTQELSKIGVVK